MRIVFAGDIHGNNDHLEWVMTEAAARGADLVYSVGDFGYWPHYASGQDFLRLAYDLADELDLPLLWIPGNHENWNRIDDLVAKHGTHAPIPTPPKRLPRHIPDDLVRVVPRGCVVEFNGVRLLGFGGAWSVDWAQRVKGKSWWPQECITPAMVDALADEPVDILVTHEAPQGPAISYKDDIVQSVLQRDLVSEIVAKTTPSLVVCGHHHVRERWVDERTGAEVQVLGRDGDYRLNGEPVNERICEESILLIDTTRWVRERRAAALAERQA